jgi:membrane associated rhomboid family serine protease
MQGWERIQYSFKPLIPLPPNPNFDLGEGREGGKCLPNCTMKRREATIFETTHPPGEMTVTYNAGIGVNPMQSSTETTSAPGTTILAAILLIIFGIEIATHRVGNEYALLEMGALPADAQLHGEYWRILTYSFLHLNWNHILLNLALFLWVGRIVERRVGIGRGALIYFTSVILGAVAILVKYSISPGQGSAVGASAGIFG